MISLPSLSNIDIEVDTELEKAYFGEQARSLFNDKILTVSDKLKRDNLPSKTKRPKTAQPTYSREKVTKKRLSNHELTSFHSIETRDTEILDQNVKQKDDKSRKLEKNISDNRLYKSDTCKSTFGRDLQDKLPTVGLPLLNLNRPSTAKISAKYPPSHSQSSNDLSDCIQRKRDGNIMNRPRSALSSTLPNPTLSSPSNPKFQLHETISFENVKSRNELRCPSGKIRSATMTPSSGNIATAIYDATNGDNRSVSSSQLSPQPSPITASNKQSRFSTSLSEIDEKLLSRSVANLCKSESHDEKFLSKSVANLSKSESHEISPIFTPVYSSCTSEDSHEEIPLTPRSRFIASCMREGLNPRANMILRKHRNGTLNLSHYSIGDKIAKILAESLMDLPGIQCVDLSDNGLTDISMVSCIQAMSKIPNLLEINLSSNTIGSGASKAISEYLSMDSCPLQRLLLSNANIDDYECEQFMIQLKNNYTLTEIDMSSNLIGSAEQLNVVQPDFITGGEAIADVIRSNTKLKILKLGWNMIRLHSAVDLASSLAQNKYLVYLDLSCNSLGREGGETLGNAILSNLTLETLILLNNGIESRACFTICMGIIENFALRKVSLDGNPIGVQGAKALMSIPMAVGDRVRVSCANCNIAIKDPNSWYDMSNPCGEYKLDLSNSYDRAVSFAVLRLAAGHQRTSVTDVSYNNVALNLTQVMSPHVPNDIHNKAGENQLNSLKMIKNRLCDEDYATGLFTKINNDKLNGMDLEELAEAMFEIGFRYTLYECSQLHYEFDLDTSGFIEIDEFLHLLHRRHLEVTTRMRNLTGQLILVDDIVLRNRYLPPLSGFLNIKVFDAVAPKSLFKVMSALEKEHVFAVAKNSGHLTAMMGHAVENTILALSEANQLYETMHKDSLKTSSLLMKLLPLLDNPADTRKVLLFVTNGDRTQMSTLKQAIGLALRPLCGQYDGYYRLNLGLESSQICLKKLMEFNEIQRLREVQLSRLGGPGRIGDTSQKGNWSCFRNEVLNSKEPIIISSKTTLNNLPKRGVLEFDFMSSFRPDQEELFNVLNAKRLFMILEKCNSMAETDRHEAFRYLHKCRENCNRIVKGNGATNIESSESRALEIGHAMHDFYTNLHIRKESTDQNVVAEVVKTDYMLDKDREHNVNKEQTTIKSTKKAKKGSKNPKNLKKNKSKTSQEFTDPKIVLPSNDDAKMMNNDDNKDDEINGNLSSTGDSSNAPPPNSNFRNSRNGSMKAKKVSDVSAELMLLKASLIEQCVPFLDNETTMKASDIFVDDYRYKYLPKPADNWMGSSRRRKAVFTIYSDFPDLVLPLSINVDPLNMDPIPSPPSELEGIDSTTKDSTPLTLQNAAKLVIENKNNAKSPKRPSDVHRFDGLTEDLNKFLTSDVIGSSPKAARLLSYLEETLSQVWMKCRYLSFIVSRFQEYGSVNKTEYFGSYRVDLIVSTFARILDLHNFELVLQQLTSREAGCLICRVGWLKLYNPMKPEGAYVLNIGRQWEERQVAKILCALEVHEPGANWISHEFRWEHDSATVPGWQLTQPWLTDEGMVNRGILNVRYYSGEGRGLYQCQAHVQYRKSLTYMVLVDELLAVEDYEIDSLDNDIKIQYVEKNLAYKRKLAYTFKRDSLPKLGFKVGSEKSEKSLNTDTDSVEFCNINREDEREGEEFLFENSKQWLEYFYPFKRKIKHDEGD